MLGGMPHTEAPDLASAIDESKDVRELILRLTRLAQRGRLETFVELAAADRALDEKTRECILELASAPLLATVEPRLGRRYNRPGRAISSVG